MRIASYFKAYATLNFARFPVYRTEVAPDPRDADAWILPGSANGVYEDLPWMRALRRFTQDIAGRSIPLLGICFGHQLMASALGGKVEKSVKGRGIGLHTYDLTAEGQSVFPGFAKLRLLAAHQDQVVEPPPQATLLATSSFCTYAAFSYGKHMLSIQPHPEFTPAYERFSIDQWQKEDPIDDKAVHAALQSIESGPPDAPAIAPMLSRFLSGEPLPI